MNLIKKIPVALLVLGSLSSNVQAAAVEATQEIPRALGSYPNEAGAGVWRILTERAAAEPFNLVATIIFLCAVTHTFFTRAFLRKAHKIEVEHHVAEGETTGLSDKVSLKIYVLRYLGHVEAVFGNWVLVLVAAIIFFKGVDSVVDYIGHRVNFTEPIFVVVVMAIASTRPILQLATSCLRALARLGRGTVAAWWLAILTTAPILGSIITEPAAMTIAALLLAKQFYRHRPSVRLCYATLGLLFVNISIGGTLTHFAAPPVLMVAIPWGWDTAYMLLHFGWKTLVAIGLSTLAYYWIFRRDFAELQRQVAADGADFVEKKKEAAVPIWVTVGQLFFLGAVVYFSHYPALFVGAFLFFLTYTAATARHQDQVDLKPAVMVGFFLASLVIHGGLQGWWIEPVLKNLGEVPLFFSAAFLSAFNDNAAVTYLATLVPDFGEGLKYAVVSGALTGGGLTVIANAPNPAGQSILQHYFPQGVTPAGLFLGALPPTAITAVCYLVL